ncbi:MAG: ABC transporter ATP-binding protein, partial [Actinomycetota bacterium]|nr:ABC transporter ATP-binding protein [Actinomycetota bacterium]
MTYRSMTRDRSVAGNRIDRALVRRIFGYAGRYRGIIAFYLVTFFFVSLLSVAQPLLVPRLVDDGISQGNARVVTITALTMAALAIVDAALGLVSRWYSARIGEGLIFDLRTEVYDHVQRQSIAFFTRAQTGALISRLNSDVMGAQQAFTSTLGGVLGNLISATVVLIAMFALSWQVTVVSLVLVPVFLIPARWMGRRLQILTREQMGLNADMSTQMTERFNVAGALLVKLFGRPEDETASFSNRAERVRDIGVRMAMANRWFFTGLALVASLATAIVYGL